MTIQLLGTMSENLGAILWHNIWWPMTMPRCIHDQFTRSHSIKAPKFTLKWRIRWLEVEGHRFRGLSRKSGEKAGCSLAPHIPMLICRGPVHEGGSLVRKEKKRDLMAFLLFFEVFGMAFRDSKPKIRGWRSTQGFERFSFFQVFKNKKQSESMS